MTNLAEDDELRTCLRLARQRDAAGERRLAEFVAPLIAKIVNSHLPRGASFDDWSQEALLRVFQRLEQFRGDAPFQHWVAKVAVNVCRDLLRTTKRRREVRWSELSENEAAVLRDSVRLIDREASPADRAAARELTEKLLESLSADDRLIIKMLDMEERAVAEIAALIGSSQTLVKVRAFRARRKIRAIMKHLLDEDHDAR